MTYSLKLNDHTIPNSDWKVVITKSNIVIDLSASLIDQVTNYEFVLTLSKETDEKEIENLRHINIMKLSEQSRQIADIRGNINDIYQNKSIIKTEK